MFQNQLLQIKESAPMRNMLSKLHGGDPLVRISLDPGARFTHLIPLNIHNKIRLFKDDSIQNLLLNLHDDLDPFGVGLSPNKVYMYHPRFIRIEIFLQLFQAKGCYHIQGNP
ncbi:hypothetical protein S245_070808 [Arachis hypogaea]